MIHLSKRIPAAVLTAALILSMVACSAAFTLDAINIAEATAVTLIQTDGNLSPATKASYTSALTTFSNSLSTTATACKGLTKTALFQCLGTNLIPAFQTAINSGAAGVKNPAEQAKVNAYLALVQTAINILYQNQQLSAPAPAATLPPVTTADLEPFRQGVARVMIEAKRRRVQEEYVILYARQAAQETEGAR